MKLDDEVDLNAGPQRQRGHRDRRAGGKGLGEMLGVDAIHRAEVTHVREIHAGARNVIETLAGRLENRREIPEDALCLGHNTPLDHRGGTLSDYPLLICELLRRDQLRTTQQAKRRGLLYGLGKALGIRVARHVGSPVGHYSADLAE